MAYGRVKSEPIDLSESSLDANPNYAAAGNNRATRTTAPASSSADDRSLESNSHLRPNTQSSSSSLMHPPYGSVSAASSGIAAAAAAHSYQLSPQHPPHPHSHSNQYPPPVPPAHQPIVPTMPANCHMTPDGDRFYVTLLFMLEKGRWVPITEVSILDPGFIVPSQCYLEFRPAGSDLGTSKELTASIVQRFHSVDAFFYDNPLNTPQQKAKYAKEYTNFFKYLAKREGRENFARIEIPALTLTGPMPTRKSITFYLKGPDVRLSSAFNEQEPIICFFTAPSTSDEWTPSEFVNHAADPAWASKVQQNQPGRTMSPMNRYESYAYPQHQQHQHQQAIYPGSSSYNTVAAVASSSSSAATSPHSHYLPADGPRFVPNVPISPPYHHPATPNVKPELPRAPVATPRPTPTASATNSSAAAVASSTDPAPSVPATVASSASAAPATPVAASAPAPPPPTAVAPATPTTSIATAQMSPQFLRDLTHQHDWPFGALAELVHNAKDAGAKNCRITVEYIGAAKVPHLIIDDDGSGMTHQELVNALSFGRQANRLRSKSSIGRYGFGLKHGAIRLGDDVLVLTASTTTFSQGLLSCTYNKDQTAVRVPICTRLKDKALPDLSVNSKEQAEEAEDAIYRNSVLNHFEIGKQLGLMKAQQRSGTRIIIWNLRKSEVEGETKNKVDSSDDEGTDSDDEDEKKRGEALAKKQRLAAHKAKLQKLAAEKRAEDAKKPAPVDAEYELKFASFPGDIQIVIDSGSNMQERSNQLSTDVPLDYSLKAYLSMVFLESSMQMFIRSVQVVKLDWKIFLSKTREYACPLPHFEGCKLLLGESALEKSRGNAGMMLYWHNCLIETYRRVGVQTNGNDAGLGVIGVFDMPEKVEPANNKQKFPQNNKYFKKILKWFAIQVDDYWHNVLEKDRIETEKVLYETMHEVNEIYHEGHAVECDSCKKWRRITKAELDYIDGKTDINGNPGDFKEQKWFCFMNRDKAYGRCDIPQDPTMEDKHEIVVKVSRGSAGEASNSAAGAARLAASSAHAAKNASTHRTPKASTSSSAAAAASAAPASAPSAAATKKAAQEAETKREALRIASAKQREIEAALAASTTQADDDTDTVMKSEPDVDASYLSAHVDAPFSSSSSSSAASSKPQQQPPRPAPASASRVAIPSRVPIPTPISTASTPAITPSSASTSPKLNSNGKRQHEQNGENGSSAKKSKVTVESKTNQAEESESEVEADEESEEEQLNQEEKGDLDESGDEEDEPLVYAPPARPTKKITTNGR